MSGSLGLSRSLQTHSDLQAVQDSLPACGSRRHRPPAGRQPGLGQRGLHPQGLLPPTTRTARPITDEEPGVPGRPDPARGHSAHSTENGRVCILPVTLSVSWKSSGRLQARPTAGRRSSPGPGPAPRWTARRPAPWPALAAPARTEAVGVSAPPCPPAPPWATCRPLPTTTKLRARVAGEGLVSAAPMPSVRTHTHLQCRVEDDVPPTAASARQQNPQSASPTPTRLCSSQPHPPPAKASGAPPRARLALRGRGRARGPHHLGLPPDTHFLYSKKCSAAWLSHTIWGRWSFSVWMYLGEAGCGCGGPPLPT